MRGASRLALLALLAAVCVGSSQACSTASYADSSTVVSTRNMDFANLPPLSVVVVPTGSNDTFLPVFGASTYSTLGRTYARKYNYACVSFARKVFYDAAAKVFPALKRVNITNWPGVCNDGLNEAGLAVSLQWQLDTPAVPSYDPLKPGPSINEGDVANYILANYGSVAELQAALNNGLTVTWNPAFSYAARLAVKTPFIPCHWGVWDKFNNSLVIEFGPSGLTVFSNPTGVLTNNPLFPQQLQYLSWWQQVITSPPYTSYTPTMHETTFYPPPGSYNSSDRFTRLAILKSSANLSPWRATTNPMSPAFILEQGSSNSALIAALDLIQSVYLPKGTDDSGGVGQNETDWTIFTTMRDHTKSNYYWRIANSPSWSVVKLSAVNWAKLRLQRQVGALLMLPNPWWALDVSALVGDSSDADASLSKLRSCLTKCVGGQQDAAALTSCVAACV